jgi:valyl-tRNA synthetase
LTPTDQWLLARLQQAIEQATAQFEAYEFARARATVEDFFWNVLADNYIEMAKQRLYGAEPAEGRAAACYSLYQGLLNTIKLLAPFMPHITEEIYQRYFSRFEGARSIHLAHWPSRQPAWAGREAALIGAELIAIATEVRRFKSSSQRSLGAELARLVLITEDENLKQALGQALVDIQSVTRAREVIVQAPGLNGVAVQRVSEALEIGIVA